MEKKSGVRVVVAADVEIGDHRKTLALVTLLNVAKYYQFPMKQAKNHYQGAKHSVAAQADIKTQRDMTRIIHSKGHCENEKPQSTS